MAGALLAAHPGLYMQTHVAENRDEVRWVAELFPRARSYLDVYRQHGLLNRRAVLAHGVWLDADDRALLRDSGAQIAHCPSSNLFLGSGLFGWTRAARRRRAGQRWPATSAAAPPVDAAHAGRRLQGAGAARRAPDGLEGAARGHARRGAGAATSNTRSAASSPARWPT